MAADIPAVGAEFLRDQRMVVIGAVDDEAAPWVTVLTGMPGFMEATSDRTVIVRSLLNPGDPLATSLAADAEVGMLTIEPQTRRRMRINGRSTRTNADLVVSTEQVYANCPKYIQVRHLESDIRDDAAVGSVRTTDELTIAQQEWIAAADAFFVATYAPGHGADASHRGGDPGSSGARRTAAGVAGLCRQLDVHDTRQLGAVASLRFALPELEGRSFAADHRYGSSELGSRRGGHRTGRETLDRVHI
nr:pyridoxamine 5'-phosphate oxidase family protein [Kribbella sp. VKM Ac-2566]